jgi:uncharacterized membrane protein YphA (DoxX/SURF4 family)
MTRDFVDNPALAASLLLGMFFLSGNHKLFHFTKTVESLKTKIGDRLSMHNFFYELAIYLVILLEILAPLFIIYYLSTEKQKTVAMYSVWSLIAFTVLATIIYHPPNFNNYYKSVPFWANVSLTGGLLLLANHIQM